MSILHQLLLVHVIVHTVSSVSVNPPGNLTVKANSRVSLHWYISFTNSETFENLTLYSKDSIQGIENHPIYSYDKTNSTSGDPNNIFNSHLQSLFRVEIGDNGSPPNKHLELNFTIFRINKRQPFEKLQLEVVYTKIPQSTPTNLESPTNTVTTQMTTSTTGSTTSSTTSSSSSTTITTKIEITTIPGSTTTGAPQIITKKDLTTISIREGPSICGKDMLQSYNLTNSPVNTILITVETCGNPPPNITWFPPSVQRMQMKSEMSGTFENISGTGLNKTFTKTRYTFRISIKNFCDQTLRYEITGDNGTKISKQSTIFVKVKPKIEDIMVYKPSSGCMFIHWSVKNTGFCQVTKYTIDFYNSSNVMFQRTFSTEAGKNFYAECENPEQISSLVLSTRKDWNIESTRTGKKEISALLFGRGTKESADNSMEGAVIALAVLLALFIIFFVLCFIYVRKRYTKNHGYQPKSGVTPISNTISKKSSNESMEVEIQEMYEVPNTKDHQQSALKKNDSIKNDYVTNPVKKSEKRAKESTKTTKKPLIPGSMNHKENMLYQNKDVIDQNKSLTKPKKPKKVPVPEPQEIYQNFSTTQTLTEPEEQTIYEVPPEDE